MTQINPHKTPFAITRPMSVPRVKSIVHNARKPANVVRDEPNTDWNVSMIASDIASVFFNFLLFCLACSYLWYKNIEKSIVTPSWRTAVMAFVMYDIWPKKIFEPRL